MLDPRMAQMLGASGKRIVITGAGGWLGLATLDSLAAAMGSSFDRSVVAFGSTTRDLHLRDGIVVRQRPLADMAQLAPEPTWVLHFAFLTKDRAEAMDEAAYRAANATIRDTVLAALDQIGTEALFVASSGAAYKAQDETANAAMRLYGRLKADDEAAFSAWGTAAGKRVVIGRIFNLTGPYINKHQAYALASFILDGLAGQAIAVRAPRQVVRGYVAIPELMSLAFAELADSASGTVRFDSGGEALELAEVAQVVAGMLGQADVHRAPISDPVADIYHGDHRAYLSLLARHGLQHQELEGQVAKTIDYLRAAQ